MAEGVSHLAHLAAEVEAATQELEQATAEERSAKTKVLNARDRLDKAQKAIDEAIDAMKSRAPADTFWGSDLHGAVMRRSNHLVD